MRQCPKVYPLKQLAKIAVDSKTLISIRLGPTSQTWVPARPVHYDTIKNRLKAAWLVFTGKADAVVWPGDQ